MWRSSWGILLPSLPGYTFLSYASERKICAFERAVKPWEGGGACDVHLRFCIYRMVLRTGFYVCNTTIAEIKGGGFFTHSPGKTVALTGKAGKAMSPCSFWPVCQIQVSPDSVIRLLQHQSMLLLYMMSSPEGKREAMDFCHGPSRGFSVV